MKQEHKPKLHPFVAAHIAGRKYREILDEHPEFSGPLFEGMRAFVAAVTEKIPAREAIRQAENVSLEGEDPLLAVLFLTAWVSASTKISRVAEAMSLVRRCREILPPDAPPVVEARILHAESQITGIIGDKAASEELLRRTLKVLPFDSPSRPISLVDYSFFLSMFWRLPELDAELERVVQHDPERYAARVALGRCCQLTETGHTEEALRQLSMVECDQVVTASHKMILTLVRGLLALLQDRPLPSDDGQDILMPLGLLAARRPEEALARVRATLTENLDNYLSAATLPGFNLVRAELACGHGPAARRIMEIRRRRGNTHPLDDFFLARAELLCGNREPAAALFARTLQMIEKYSAQGRLEFELKMSCELSPSDMLRLMRGTAAVGGGTAPALPVPEPLVAPKAESRGLARMVGPSAAMEAVREAVRRYAALDAPVLITGETGTGKELVARALHEESPRRARPFLAVNCGAIVETLLETELFGHERGAFTGAARPHRGFFEQAGEGTVLLDEIGEVTPRLQVALLRVLETGDIRSVGASRARRISCRILAATNAELDIQAENGLFRKDLLFRLRRLEVRIPPLRERREDILPLVDHFLSEGRAGGRRAVLSPELKEELRGRNWPGNVRELKNEVERMRLLNSDGESYDLSALSPSVGKRPAAAPPEVVPEPTSTPPLAEDGNAVMEQILSTSRVSLRRQERLRGLFRRYEKVTRAEAMKVLDISQATATRDLQALCRESFIEKVEPTKSPRTHYFRLR